MISRTLSMMLVNVSADSVRVECGRCRAQHVLPVASYAASMQDGRRFVCQVCMQLGRLPDRRHHAAAVTVERRKPVQPPWVQPTIVHHA
jgi:late competence protein required for DNA uptake (superfamily II DNA/RNA helicase)